MVKHIAKIVLGEELYNIKDTEARSDLNNHASNTDIHVTAAEKEYWNSKVNPPSYSAPTAKQLTYTGEAQDLLNPGSSTSGSIQYSTDEVNWSTTIPQGTNAGTYTVYWKFAGSEIVYVDSTAINVTIAKANPTYTAPTAKTLTYNGNAQDLVNAGSSSDGTISYSSDNENWSSTIPQGTSAGEHIAYWKLTGDTNHNDVASTAINVSIAKVTPTVTAPTAKSGLTYNSTAQDLVTAGSTNYGELQYSLNGTNYSTSVATGTNAGSYTVYYKVVGNSNVNDVAATSISVSIAKGTPTVTAPTAKSLTYNGLALELVNAGVSDFGTIKYSLGVPQQVVNNNGHAYVDLGLPSGTLWATMNVGANTPEAYGNWYKYGLGASTYDNSQADYTGTEDPLSLSLDTARQVWGGSWHMPTKEQLTELTTNTTYEWTTMNGVNGVKFTASNSNYIFIPAAGYWDNSSHYEESSYGYVWGSSHISSGSIIILRFYTSDTETYIYNRKYGCSVRGVIDGASTIIVPSTYSTSIPTGTNAGTYYVYWKIEGDDNINEVSGSTAIEVTISKINSTITMSGNSTNMTPGQTNTLTISVAGGATPTITSSNTSVATVNGYTISAVGGGTTIITISTPTDDNHNGDTITYTLTSKWPNGIYAAYADGSMRTAENADTNAIGVAVITDNCKFIIDKTNDTTAAWDSQYDTNDVIAGCFATDDINTAKTNYTGVSNTNAIAAVASGGEAAKYCRSCSKTIAGKTVYGYLGACGEWLTALDNKTTVDSIMSTIGGTAIGDLFYCTSTLFLTHSEYVFISNYHYGSVYFGNKESDYLVRPLYEIS